MIRSALTDDQLLFRRGMALLLRDMAGVQVVLDRANGEELLAGLKNEAVDIVLLDLQMPVMDGVETMQRVRKEFPHVKVIVLSSHYEEQYILHLMELGANGYLLKDTEPDEIDTAIRSVAQSGYYFSDALNKMNLHGSVKKRKHTPDPLSERDVLRGIRNEFTTAEIAEKNFISPRTVEFHRNNILLNTGARNVAGLVVCAMMNNL